MASSFTLITRANVDVERIFLVPYLRRLIIHRNEHLVAVVSDG